jgi:hypothetical protein
MQNKGRRLIKDLKEHVISVIEGINECEPGNLGVSSREIEDLAGLALELPSQNGWLTWSVLSSLNQDGLVEAVRRKNRLFWRLV